MPATEELIPKAKRAVIPGLFLIVPVCKDEFAKKLMSLSLWSVPMESQERLAKYIKAKLPKARVEFAEP